MIIPWQQQCNVKNPIDKRYINGVFTLKRHRREYSVRISPTAISNSEYSPPSEKNYLDLLHFPLLLGELLGHLTLSANEWLGFRSHDLIFSCQNINKQYGVDLGNFCGFAIFFDF